MSEQMQQGAVGDTEAALPAAALVEGARSRFRAFFDELEQRFVEREDVIRQVALGLLSRQHVLLTGPPGNAKSALCKAVLNNVVDRATGQPSVFARQFTESTVQTDLVGPLNFKTLMESGRSEHFTDEGMLGAVHAFLDEVLDGRDMLLRSTLNMLQERELKQGQKTTKGDIECALMTTNRYLAEVLEQSRETLLAFIDRIAFVSFVPKGFGDAGNLVTVLSRQIEGRQQAPMPLLTIQDLDILQEMTDAVVFPAHCCEALVSFLAHLEAETAAATRADPTFLPTRYISTRTVIRTAQVLRALCVYDWIVNDTDRELVVRTSDFQGLRLTLLLSGPERAHLPALLERETDPRERRQLMILQTERQLFDRAVAEIPEEPGLPSVPTVDAELPSLAGLRDKPVEVQFALCERLSEATQSGGTRGLEARRLLEEATSIVVHRAVSRGLQAGIAEREGDQAFSNLLQLASKLDRAHPGARQLAPWVRTRALEVLEAQLELIPVQLGATIAHALQADMTLQRAGEQADAVLDELHVRWQTRDALVAGGARPTEGSEQRWSKALVDVEEALVRVWTAGVLRVFDTGRADKKPMALDRALARLAEPLDQMNRSSARLSLIGGKRVRLAPRVLSNKLVPLIRRSFKASAPKGRMEVAAAVEALLQKLDDSSIHWAISETALVGWAAEVLVQADEKPRAHTAQAPSYDYEGYRRFRSGQPAVSLSFALVEVCSHIALASPRSNQDAGLPMIRKLLESLNTELRDTIIELDAARLQGTYEFIATWWGSLRHAELSPAERLEVVRGSRINELLEEESALLRFSLEAQLLGDLFPAAHQLSRELRQRLVELNDQIREQVNKWITEHTDAGWEALVAE